MAAEVISAAQPFPLGRRQSQILSQKAPLALVKRLEHNFHNQGFPARRLCVDQRIDSRRRGVTVPPSGNRKRSVASIPHKTLTHN